MDTNLILAILALPVGAILLTVWATYLHRRDQAACRKNLDAEIKP